MAKQRPSLNVYAAPVNTYVAPPAAAVELYDQQSVNLALQFADAFKDFSVTAAQLAGTLKKQYNEEDLQKGIDLVNQSRKSYKTLVDSGEIKPTENPWMAVGAQQASGTLEAMRARAHFNEVYAKRAEEDPTFFDGQTGFDVLAASYTDNVNTAMANAPYMMRSFYESFNPYIASMGVKHEEQVTNVRNQKVMTGVGSEVLKAIQDVRSPDPVIRNNAMTALQEGIDGYVASGYSPKMVNEAAINALVGSMTTGDDIEVAEEMLGKLRSGTGYIKDLPYAKTALFANAAKIEQNRERMTVAEANLYYAESKAVIDKVVAGQLKEDEALAWLDGFTSGPDRRISISANEIESKRRGMLAEIERGKILQEQKVKEENDEALLGYIFDSSEKGPLATQTEDEHYVESKKSLEERMGKMNLSNREKAGYRDIFDREWTAGAKTRQIEAIKEQNRMLWEGSGTVLGLNQTSAQEIQAFFQNPNMADVPDVGNWKRTIDQSLIRQGITPDTEKAKAIYGDAYSRFDGMLQQMEASMAAEYGGSLAPVEGESLDVRAQKAQLRANFRFVRMHMGKEFGDGREAGYATSALINTLNPNAVESAETWQAEDALMAYTMAVQNNIDLSAAVGTGPNGKALSEQLNWAASQLMSNPRPDAAANILRDMSRMKYFGTTMRVTWEDMTSNPLGWANWFGNKEDHKLEYVETVAGWQESNEVTNPDSALYVASEFQRYYMAELGATRNHSKALSTAQKQVEQNNIIVRGSMIPRGNLPREISQPFIESWLDSTFPDYPDATLVVVSRNPDGSPIMAARDADGNSIKSATGQYLFTQQDWVDKDRAVKPEIIMQFKRQEEIRERRTKVKQQQAFERGRIYQGMGDRMVPAERLREMERKFR